MTPQGTPLVWRRAAFVPVLAGGALLLVTVPLLASGDQLLASIAQGTHLDAVLSHVTAPLARVTAGLLHLLGVHATAAGSDVLLQSGDTYVPPIDVTWNCIGWQSLVILGISLAVGLRGHPSRGVRIAVIVAGVMGTVLVNLVRIAAVCLVTSRYGYAAGVGVHDNGGAVLVVVWLCVFWWFAYRVTGDPGAVASRARRGSPSRTAGEG
jgi:exosortase/archaeosortase family protein